MSQKQRACGSWRPNPRSRLTFDESPLRESCTVGSMGEVPGNWHLYPTSTRACPRESGGRHREVASEGSVEQNRGLTNRNRISGISGRTSGLLIAKSISIKGQGCRSGRGAGKAIELTWGGLCRVPISELRPPRGDLTATQESADGIVGHAVGKASEALQSRKAEQQIGRAGNDGRRPERLGVASRTGNS
jgi:hypothetical protein